MEIPSAVALRAGGRLRPHPGAAQVDGQDRLGHRVPPAAGFPGHRQAPAGELLDGREFRSRQAVSSESRRVAPPYVPPPSTTECVGPPVRWAGRRGSPPPLAHPPTRRPRSRTPAAFSPRRGMLRAPDRRDRWTGPHLHDARAARAVPRAAGRISPFGPGRPPLHATRRRADTGSGEHPAGGGLSPSRRCHHFTSRSPAGGTGSKSVPARRGDWKLTEEAVYLGCIKY